MSNKYFFPTFYYQPRKLQTITKELVQKYKDYDQVPNNVLERKLPNLIEAIKRLKTSEELKEFAKNLKDLEINIICTEYPYEKQDKVTVDKIIFILLERYNRIVGRRFWQHFQYILYDKNVVGMLKHAFQVEPNNFLSLSSNIREHYNRIFSLDDEGLIDRLAHAIGQEQRSIEDSYSDWKIEEGSTLYYVLWSKILELFIGSEWFVDVQGVEVIEDRLEHLNLKNYKKIINHYLDSYDYVDYHYQLFKQLINRLGDPRENLSRWNGFTEEVIEKVKKKLFEDDLYEFLDGERFEYWRKYTRYIDDIKIVKKPPIAAMYFGDFVVVEFENIGNAAYFYETEGFNKYLASKIKNNVHESLLKDRYADYFIHRLSHSKNWVSRFDHYMVNYLQGNFYYKH